MRLTRSDQSPRWRTIAVLAVGIAIGTTMVATPAGAHVYTGGTTALNHLVGHMKKYFFTKAQSNARYADAVAGTDKAKDADKLDGKDSTELGLNWKGTWSATIPYLIRDAVEFGGSSYVALAPSTNEQPGTGASWTLLAAKGAPGATGSTGSQGPPGPPGPPAGPPPQPYSAPNVTFSLQIGGGPSFALDAVRGCFQKQFRVGRTEDSFEDCHFTIEPVPSDVMTWLDASADATSPRSSRVKDLKLRAIHTNTTTGVVGVVRHFLIEQAFIAQARFSLLDAASTDPVALDLVVVPGSITAESLTGDPPTPVASDLRRSGFKLEVEGSELSDIQDLEGVGIDVSREPTEGGKAVYQPGTPSVSVFRVGVEYTDGPRLSYFEDWAKNVEDRTGATHRETTLRLREPDGDLVLDLLLGSLEPWSHLDQMPTGGVQSLLLGPARRSRPRSRAPPTPRRPRTDHGSIARALEPSA
jgi:hypothetical protein